MILSGPRPSAADPQITPGYTLRLTLPRFGGAAFVVGPKSGNVILCNAAARSRGLCSAFVREYPLFGRYVEGPLGAHQRAVVFDDVASDGEMLADVIRHLREANAEVTHTVVLVNRTEGGHQESFSPT